MTKQKDKKETPQEFSENAHTHDDGTICHYDHYPLPQEPFRRETPKIKRNDPCHCGSGKKFKRCHGV